MAISSTTRKSETFIGDGVSTEFPFTFRVIETADVSVLRRDAETLSETELVLDSDYSVALNPRQTETPGGVVTLSSPLLEGCEAIIYSSVLPVTSLDLKNLAAFNPITLTQEVDKIYILVQQLYADNGRSIKISYFDDDDDAINRLVEGVTMLSAEIDSLSAVSESIGNINAVAGDLDSVDAVAEWVSEGSSIASQITYTPAGTGAVTTDVQTKLRETISDGDYPDLATAIAAAITGDFVIGVHQDITVHIPTDAATLQDVFDRVSPANKHCKINVLIESGNPLTHGLLLKDGDYSQYTIAAEDSTVLTATTFVPVDSSPVPESTNAIFFFENCQAPRLSCLIRGRGTDDYDGLIAWRNVRMRVDEDCGVENTRMNCEFREASTLAANASRWSDARKSCMRLTNGVTFSISGATLSGSWTSWNASFHNYSDAALHISRGSAGQAQGVIISDCGASAITVRRSFASIFQAELSNIGQISGSANGALRPIDGGIIVASQATVNGNPIADNNIGVQTLSLNQVNGYGIVFAYDGGVTSGVNSLGDRLPYVTDDEAIQRAGFYRWDGADGWGPADSGGGGAIRLDRSTNRGAWIASSPGGSSGDNEPELYAKSTSGATGDYGPWRRIALCGSGVTAERPSGVSVGFNYFDTTLNIPIWRSETNWVNASGDTV